VFVGVLVGVTGGVEDKLTVGVFVGVEVDVGVGVGQDPNTDIEPSVPTWNTSPPPTDLNHLSLPLNLLIVVNVVELYRGNP
jgi:hypothetical protein